jgi:hypothetical protein
LANDARRGVSAVEQNYKGRCAAMVELLSRVDDCSPEAAAKEAAEILARADARVPSGGYRAPITAGTLIQWRKDARRPKDNPELADAYERVIVAVTQRATNGTMLRRMLAALIRMPLA